MNKTEQIWWNHAIVLFLTVVEFPEFWFSKFFKIILSLILEYYLYRQMLSSLFFNCFFNGSLSLISFTGVKFFMNLHVAFPINAVIKNIRHNPHGYQSFRFLFFRVRLSPLRCRSSFASTLMECIGPTCTFWVRHLLKCHCTSSSRWFRGQFRTLLSD